MKEWLYPARMRCRACRKFFGPVVVKGQYCSYECAGERDPATVPPSEWPRKHIIKWGWPPQAKRQYFCEGDAKAARNKADQNAYLCDFCWHWHIGSPSRRPEDR
jgi:hypothetical protein